MKISAGLAEGQVLQRLGNRGATVVISGEGAKARNSITATIFRGKSALPKWKDRAVGKVSANGSFKIQLSGIPVGGPYRLMLCAGEESVSVATFYVGDVWILAGQSNMEGLAFCEEDAPKPHGLVRAFSMRREWRLAEDPLHIFFESPDVCHNLGKFFTKEESNLWRKRAGRGVGVGLFFAKEMLAKSKVPQGLICTAHGGTWMKQWAPDHEDGAEGKSLYQSMLRSVRATGQPVAGMVWYQGEAETNGNESDFYTERMKTLIAATRRDLKQARLPWLMVQIANLYREGGSENWNRVQDLQRLLPEVVRDVAIVPAMDLPSDDFVHLSTAAYKKLGARLAHVADALVYGNKRADVIPSFREIRRCKATKRCALEVVFDHVAGSLKSHGEPHGFVILDEAGKVQPILYKTTLHGNVARLYLNQYPSRGSKLMYGMGLAPVCTIHDEREMPLPVFGPVGIATSEKLLPFMTKWRMGKLLETSTPLHKVKLPDEASLATVEKDYSKDGGFINEHDAWLGKSGLAFFFAELDLKKATRLEFLAGYDGPFRLWVDEKEFFSNPCGVNPCVPDESIGVAKLAAGRHSIAVGVDPYCGFTWGFFLRFSEI